MKKFISIFFFFILCVSMHAQDMETIKRRVVMEKIAEETTAPVVTEFKTENGKNQYIVYRGLITCAEVLAKAGYDSYELTKAYQSAMQAKEAYIKFENEKTDKKEKIK